MTGTDHPGQWRLDRIELVHWGTFHGHHVVDVARRGFLLTGPSGSGKSSLVDAVTAVLTPPGRIRFNAAAADVGSRRADRTVAGYVRGAWRRQADETTGEIVSDHLRTGATWSGIALRFADGAADGQTITLIKLFHLRAGENTEVSELYLMAAEPLGLLDLEPHARDGLQTRAIKAAWPQATVTDRHSVFSARFCRALGINGDNALHLLHKTQSARNLGSLDDLFRGFMLDEPTTFGLADTAVEQFTELAAAHTHVITARDQIQHLAPLRALSAAHEEAERAAARTAALLESLPAFADAWQLELARGERIALLQQEAEARQACDVADGAVRDAETAVRTADLVVLRHGGQALALREAEVQRADVALRTAEREREILTRNLAAVGIAAPTTAAELEELCAAARGEQERADAGQADERAGLLALFDALSAARSRRDGLDRELAALKRVRSNLPADVLEARRLVCRATGLSPDLLPFAGELIQVRPEHAEWTGPIERVLRPLATVLLVPALHRATVVRAVDTHHLRARLVLEIVPAGVEPPRLVGSPGSLVHRVQVKDGPMRPWMEGVLSRQYDYECVADDTGLAGVDRAVTRAGTVKRGPQRLEKDDRFPVDDRARWVLGFDNAEKVEHLLGLRREVEAEVAAAEQSADAASQERDRARDRLNALRAVADREWREIDVDGARAALRRAETAHAELLAGDTDLRRAQAEADAARAELEEAKVAAGLAQERRTAAVQARARVDQLIADGEARAAPPVPPDHHAELEQRFYAVQRSVRYDVVDRLTRQVQTKLQTELDASRRTSSEAAQEIVSVQARVRHRWPALVGDLTDVVEDRTGYLALLGRLETDRLPDFEERFFGLLQTQSQRNIGQLAAVVRRAPGEIRDKVVPINTSLRRSPFDRGRFLQIQVHENRGTAVQDFLADLREISTGAWAVEDRAAAERRFEVMARVLRRLGSSESGDRAWRSLCLDTRRHVRFTGVEVDADDVVVNIHDSSAGLSGGQRQKLVVFCLAAALRYQLTEDGQDVPRFGTVILDEAFDKADATFTRMAMDVFVEFGFHMVLATPLKLLQTLEDYVGGVGLATCRDFRDSQVALVTVDEAHRAERTIDAQQAEPTAVPEAIR